MEKIQDLSFRLLIYESIKDKFLKHAPYTETGFCSYFHHHFHSMEIEMLPELMLQKPEKTYGVWWFKPRDIYSRIKCLEKAIKLTKQKINNYDNTTIE